MCLAPSRQLLIKQKKPNKWENYNLMPESLILYICRCYIIPGFCQKTIITLSKLERVMIKLFNLLAQNEERRPTAVCSHGIHCQIITKVGGYLFSLFGICFQKCRQWSTMCRIIVAVLATYLQQSDDFHTPEIKISSQNHFA